jgi:RNA-directed DNA polymerase
MVDRARIARELAAFLLAGTWSKRRLIARCRQYLGTRAPKAIRRLVDDILAGVSTPYPPPPRALVQALMDSHSFDAAARGLLRADQPPPMVLQSAAFRPAEAFAGLPVPRLETPADLATWLNLPVERLDWLADIRDTHARAETPALQHYSYVFVPKHAGPPRLLEAPKASLKSIQRRILHEILDHVPAHPNAHGFVRGRSCISGALLHAGEHVVVRLDLRRFFTSIKGARVHGLFRAIGYPWATARLLTGLCTTRTPIAVLTRFQDWRVRQEHGTPHLPQGAPTSPALANLCAWRLDHRLSGLARRAGIHTSRYADDLSFSGDRDFAKRLSGFLRLAQTIVEDEGFLLNPEKTRISFASSSQRVTGIVVNQHINAPRQEYEALKAILHNCQTGGDPMLQNRDGHADFKRHLDGRIGWIGQLNPRRGHKLRLMFDAINWEGPAQTGTENRG